jgi:hypothetical protein
MRRQSTLTGHVVVGSSTWPRPGDRDRRDQRDGLEPAPGGQEVPRHFRLRLTLDHEGDWLTSDIAFVRGSP